MRFELTSGSGNFANGSNKYGYETLETTTNADGKASTTLTTGSKTGTYRISVHARVVHSRYIGIESTEPFTLTVIETTLPPQQQQETQQQQEDPQEQEQPLQQEQERQQQSEPDAQPEPPSQQQQEPVDGSDTDITQQQQEPPPQQEQERQQQSEPDAQPEPPSQQQQEPVDGSDTDTPKQQQEPLPQQEQEEQGQQQSEPDAQPEPNYTIIPFDYEKEGVGKVVGSCKK